MLKFGVPSLKKFLIAPQTENIFKGLIFTPFSASTTVFAFAVANIQPNSKLHPLTEILWIHSWPEVSCTHKLKMREQNASYLVKDSE